MHEKMFSSIQNPVTNKKNPKRGLKIDENQLEHRLDFIQKRNSFFSKKEHISHLTPN